VLLAAVACGGDGNGPVGPTPPTTTPAPTVRSLDISGAMSLGHPGETSQLTATVRMSDDTTRDVTAQAVWNVMPEGVATVSRGLITAIGYGRASLTVRYPSLNVLVRTVRVAPAGTFVLTGTVTEAGGDFPLDLAEVEVTSASGMLTTMSDTMGRYMLAPVPTGAIVHVEKDGFEPYVKRWTGDRDEELNLELRRIPDTSDFRGVYRLTIAASASCALPPEAMQRTYRAQIEERAGSLIVLLDGADFVGSWYGEGVTGFKGKQDGSAVRFEISSDFAAEYYVVERFEPGRDVYFSGTATGTVSDSRVTAAFSGTIAVRASGWAPPGGPLGECQSVNHRLEFVK
jgi:hypothetical protein